MRLPQAVVVYYYDAALMRGNLPTMPPTCPRHQAPLTAASTSTDQPPPLVKEEETVTMDGSTNTESSTIEMADVSTYKEGLMTVDAAVNTEDGHTTTPTLPPPEKKDMGVNMVDMSWKPVKLSQLPPHAAAVPAVAQGGKPREKKQS